MAPFRYSHRVTYAECTVGNHIYYGRYLELLEAARGEFFRSSGVAVSELQEQGTIFPVRECRLRYRSPARYDDVLTIEVWVIEAKGARLDLVYRVTDASGRLVLEAESFHACAGLDGRPKRLPEELLARKGPGLGEQPR